MFYFFKCINFLVLPITIISIYALLNRLILYRFNNRVIAALLELYNYFSDTIVNSGDNHRPGWAAVPPVFE